MDEVYNEKGKWIFVVDHLVLWDVGIDVSLSWDANEVHKDTRKKEFPLTSVWLDKEVVL